MTVAASMMFRILACWLLLISAASAQSAVKTSPQSAKITTGLTYQQLLAAGSKQSITIQNNNTTDSCWITIGPPNVAGNTTASTVTINAVSLTALQASVVLVPGASYTRYYPLVPNDVILGTCTTTGDSLYVDVQ